MQGVDKATFGILHTFLVFLPKNEYGSSGGNRGIHQANPGIRNLCYKARLNRLGLHPWNFGRMWSDPFEITKILRWHDRINVTVFSNGKTTNKET